MSINSYIEHTNLDLCATKEDIKNLCEEAKKYHFESVCVNPCYVELAKELLEDSQVKVSTVIGFPLGATPIAVKEYETIVALESGADEFNLVINVGALKDKDYDYIKEEIETVRDSISGKPLTIMIDTNYLTKDEIIKVTEICNETFVNYISISTGFVNDKLNLDDIKIINEHKNEILEISVSGGIYDYKILVNMIEAGANRISTNNSVKIITEEEE